MVLTGSIAATALPLTASAEINGKIAIREGGEQDPDGITQDGITFGTLDSTYSDCLNSNNLWGVCRWPDTGCGYVIESVSGDKLVDKLYEIKTSDTEWEVKIRKSHKVLVTTEKTVSGLSTEDAISVDSFPVHFDLPDGFVTNDPLRHSSWTVWYGIDDMNTICDYPSLAKHGEPHTISAGSTGIDLSMTDVSGLYSVSEINFYKGITIIQFQNDYKTFDIPVKNAVLQQEKESDGSNKTVTVRKDNEDWLDMEDDYFYLCYYDEVQKSFKISNSAMKYEKDVWDEINAWVTADPTLDTNNLFLCRKVTVNVGERRASRADERNRAHL